MEDKRLIKNRESIAVSRERAMVLDILEAGIKRVLPSVVMRSSIRYNSQANILSAQDKAFDVSRGRIFVIGGGKASGAMAEALEAIVPLQKIHCGIINCRHSSYAAQKIEIVEAGSPIPDERGIKGVRRMLAIKDQCKVTQDDLVLCLISGGGSALLPCPADGITLSDKQEITRLLLKCGAPIHEINVVRKHLSKTKGGQLGRHFSPAQVVSLILSDVIGNPLASIASGPTVPDPSTFGDACAILEKYKLQKKSPRSIVDHLQAGMRGKREETPKALSNCRNFIVGDNQLALSAMAEKAKALGLNPLIVTSEQKGEPGDEARAHAEKIIEGKYKDYDLLLIGGETTPALPDAHGIGGRNQHYAATTLSALKNHPGNWVAASMGSDGSDFIAEAAGAIVDRATLDAAAQKGLDLASYIDRYDSFSLFQKIGRSLIKTGDTGTNVCDLIVYLLR